MLEFKRRQPGRDLARSAEEALIQIQERGYAAELEAAGAAPIRRIGIAFSGKEVAVRCAGDGARAP